MSAKYSFALKSERRRRPLPNRIIIGQTETETINHVVLKLLAYVLFYRERLQIEPRLDNDHIPFVPDLVHLDYQLRPTLWIECGECGVNKLHKLAVKVPEAELWILKRSPGEAAHLLRAMEKAGLRRNRYDLIGFEAGMFDELCGLLGTRNELVWFSGAFRPPAMQFEFNGLWFDAPFHLHRF